MVTKNTKKLVATSTTILFVICTQKEHYNKLKTKIFTTYINNKNCVTNVIIESKWNWILGVLIEEGQIESQSKVWNYAIVFAIDEEYCTQGWCYW
jgi:hypothetical protein